MADAAGMRAKINTGVVDNNQAANVIHQVMNGIDQTVMLWQTVTDKPEMVAAIQTLRNAKQGLEETLPLITSANNQAESYSSRL